MPNTGSGTNGTTSMPDTGAGHADSVPARHTGTAAPTDTDTDDNRANGTMTTPTNRSTTPSRTDSTANGATTSRTGGPSNGSTTTKPNIGMADSTPPPTSPHGTRAGTLIERPGGTAGCAGTGPADEPTRHIERGGADLYEEPAVPRSLVVVTVVAVAIVAAVTMVTSYTHTHDLAVVAGWGWLAGILPAAVDGLVVAGSTSLMVDRHLRGRSYPGHPLAWAAIAIGLASSMAANIVAVDPTLVDMRVVRWVMAGYAPLALALSGHLLLRMLGKQR